MNTVNILLLAIISNIDNIPIALTTKITRRLSLVISLITSIIIFFALSVQNLLVSNNVNSIINNLSSIFIITMGICGLLNNNINREEKMPTKGIYALIFGISLNNIIIAISINESTYNTVLFTIFNFLTSYIFFYIGRNIKENTKSKIISICSSVLLVLIGLVQILKH